MIGEIISGIIDSLAFGSNDRTPKGCFVFAFLIIVALVVLIIYFPDLAKL
tara:strand:- start:18911 stop:19060 length:150 start_codon:yes stop_codon:yes gene_type:complete